MHRSVRIQKKPRQRNAPASREKILQAAIELFSQKGFAAAGVDELAERSGIAKTAIYYHFGNKDGLLASVLEKLATEWIERIESVSHEVDDPMDRLDRALAGMRAMLEDRPWIIRTFLIMALEVADEKPEVRAILQKVGRRAREAVARGIHEAVQVELPKAELIGRVMLAMLIAITVSRHFEERPINLDMAFNEIRQMTTLLIAAQTQPDFLAHMEEQARALARDSRGQQK